MRTRTLTLLTAIPLVGLCTTAVAQVTAYTIQGFGTVLTSAANGGTEWLDSYEFRIGGFSSPLGNPATQFLSLPSIWKDLSSPGGSYSSVDNEALGSGSLSSPSATFGNSEQLYLWGYNTRTPGSATEWLLLTSTSWTTGTIGSVASVNFDTLPPTTVQVLLGSFSPGSDDFNGTFTSFNAVPEPSTYALVFGLSALGFVGYRRVRQRRGAVAIEAAKA